MPDIYFCSIGIHRRLLAHAHFTSPGGPWNFFVHFLKDETLLRTYSRFTEIYRLEFFSHQKKQDEEYYYLGQQATRLDVATVAGLQVAVGWLVSEGWISSGKLH